MSNRPLMPKATAVWLVDNTGLTFVQIADFTALHTLEIEAIADGGAGNRIMGLDPVMKGQLDSEEIKRCEADSSARLQMKESAIAYRPSKDKGNRRSYRYTPISKRKHKLDAIAWLVREQSELNNSDICNLIGTTRPTIKSVRDGTHWNMHEIDARHPVELGLCSREDYKELLDRKKAIIEKKTKGTEKESDIEKEVKDTEQESDIEKEAKATEQESDIEKEAKDTEKESDIEKSDFVEPSLKDS